jgi:hypothetical protein
VGGGATERDFISRSGPNAEAAGMYVGATLPGRCGSQSRAPATEGRRGESNLVQAEIFSGALGSGVRTSTGTEGYARSAGFSPNRYMRGRHPEDVTICVSRQCLRFAAYRCRDPGSATVSVARVGVPPALPVPIRFPSFVPEEDGGTPSSATETVASPITAIRAGKTRSQAVARFRPPSAGGAVATRARLRATEGGMQKRWLMAQETDLTFQSGPRLGK